MTMDAFNDLKGDYRGHCVVMIDNPGFFASEDMEIPPDILAADGRKVPVTASINLGELSIEFTEGISRENVEITIDYYFGSMDADGVISETGGQSEGARSYNLIQRAVYLTGGSIYCLYYAEINYQGQSGYISMRFMFEPVTGSAG